VVSEKIVGDPSYEVDVNAPGCDVVCGVCKGDITATPGFGDPDGKVDTGDMANLLSALILGGGSPPTYEIVSPSALQLERLDLTATAGFGCPDGKVDTGDMAKLLSHLILEGAGPPTYEAPCVEVEVCP
jgi:hypothetical protein